MKSIKPPRPGKPETLSQARTWERVKTRYLQLGLCNGCAGQAAWGHQCGFAAVHPPCEDCAQVIADFPVEKPNGWRTRGGDALRATDLNHTPDADDVSEAAA